MFFFFFHIYLFNHVYYKKGFNCLFRNQALDKDFNFVRLRT